MLESEITRLIASQETQRESLSDAIKSLETQIVQIFKNMDSIIKCNSSKWNTPNGKKQVKTRSKYSKGPSDLIYTLQESIESEIPPPSPPSSEKSPENSTTASPILTRKKIISYTLPNLKSKLRQGKDI